MSEHNPVKAIDSAIERAELRLQRLRQFRDLVIADPAFVDDLASILQGDDGGRNLVNGKSKAPSDNAGRTQFDIVRDFLKSKNGKWCRASEIVNSTGLKRGGVSFILYSTQASEEVFESRPVRGSKKNVEWRLKKGGGVDG